MAKGWAANAPFPLIVRSASGAVQTWSVGGTLTLNPHLSACNLRSRHRSTVIQPSGTAPGANGCPPSAGRHSTTRR